MKNQYYLRIKNNYVICFCETPKYIESIFLHNDPQSGEFAVHMYAHLPLRLDRRDLISINPNVYIVLRKIVKKIGSKLMYVTNRHNAHWYSFGFTDKFGKQHRATIRHKENNNLYFVFEISKSKSYHCVLRKIEHKLVSRCYEIAKKLYFSIIAYKRI